MKECSKCKEKKELEEFYKKENSKDGVDYVCKKCKNEASHRYHRENKDLIRENKIKYRKEKHQEILDKDKKRYQLKKHRIKDYYHENREEILTKRKKLYQEKKEQYRESGRRKYRRRKLKNPEGIAESARNFYERHKNEPKYKMLKSIRWGVARIVRSLKRKKLLRSVDYLGCSLEEFIFYIESQFKEGMSWDNHGVDGWHLDHKIPLDWFIKNSPDPWSANHYTNLQPMWWYDNLSKGASMDHLQN
jgi:hypothetical protein